MADNLQATPRNELLGLLYDAMSGGINWMKDPQRSQQMQGFGGLLESTGIPETTGRLAYGEPLTTGAGGLGGTSRVRPEVLEAAMNVLPMAAPAAKLAGRAIRATEGMPVGMSIKDVGKSNINIQLNEGSNFLSAKSEFGQVGGTIRQPDRISDVPYLQINYAEVEQASRGKGKGKELYQALIDEAKSRGLRVFSDSTVEKPAVNVYKSLEKKGYKLNDMTTGSLEDGTVYGSGASKPAFEISVPQQFTYPQQAALDLAQQRAALPVSEGGLGLPANNTPMDRAKAMGFDNPVYHATEYDFSAIKPSSQGKMGAGVYTSFDPSYAERYASGKNANTMPLLTRGEMATPEMKSDVSEIVRQQMIKENPDFDLRTWKALSNQMLADRGYSGLNVDKETLIFNPSNIRSRFAAFDPFRKDIATATAMGVALPDLLAAEPTPQNQSSGLLYPFP